MTASVLQGHIYVKIVTQFISVQINESSQTVFLTCSSLMETNIERRNTLNLYEVSLYV